MLMFSVFKYRMGGVQLKIAQETSQTCCCEIKCSGMISDFVVKLPWMTAFLVSASNLKGLSLFFFMDFRLAGKYCSYNACCRT